MSELYNNMAEEIFDTLKGFGRVLSLYDINGNRTYQVEKVRRVFCQPDKMMIVFDEDGDNSEIRMSLSDSSELSEIKNLIDTIRSISTRYNVLFTVKKYGKTLQPKDFAYSSIPVSEAQLNSERILTYDYTQSVEQREGVTMFVVTGNFKVDVFSDGEILSWIAEPGDTIKEVSDGVYIIARDEYDAVIASTEKSSADEKIEKLISNQLVESQEVEDDDDQVAMPSAPHIMVEFHYDGDNKVAKELISQFDDLELFSNVVSGDTRKMIFILPSDSVITAEDYVDEVTLVLSDLGVSASIEIMGGDSDEDLFEAIKEGDCVKTPDGEGEVVSVDGQKYKVKVESGKIRTFHKDDVEKKKVISEEIEDDQEPLRAPEAIDIAIDNFRIGKYSRKSEITKEDKKDIIDSIFDHAQDITDYRVDLYDVEHKVETELLPKIEKKKSVKERFNYNPEPPDDYWRSDALDDKIADALDYMKKEFEPEHFIEGFDGDTYGVYENALARKEDPEMADDEDVTISEKEIKKELAYYIADIVQKDYFDESDLEEKDCMEDADDLYPSVAKFLKDAGVIITTNEDVIPGNVQKSFRNEIKGKKIKGKELNEFDKNSEDMSDEEIEEDILDTVLDHLSKEDLEKVYIEDGDTISIDEAESAFRSIIMDKEKQYGIELPFRTIARMVDENLEEFIEAISEFVEIED